MFRSGVIDKKHILFQPVYRADGDNFIFFQQDIITKVSLKIFTDALVPFGPMRGRRKCVR